MVRLYCIADFCNKLPPRWPQESPPPGVWMLVWSPPLESGCSYRFTSNKGKVASMLGCHPIFIIKIRLWKVCAVHLRCLHAHTLSLPSDLLTLQGSQLPCCYQSRTEAHVVWFGTERSTLIAYQQSLAKTQTRELRSRFFSPRFERTAASSNGLTATLGDTLS